MRAIKRGQMLIMLLLALLAVVSSPALAQVATTTVSDTVYRADGTPASGTVVVSWSAFTTAAGQAVAAGTASATLGPNGALSIALAPNASATPLGSYYTAVLHLNDGTTNQQYWVIPSEPAGTTVKLAGIENQVLPVSVAMQTVSKAYVDAAVANAEAGITPQDSSQYVLKTGDTMTGPLVLPGNPVSANQAADKSYVDTNIAATAAGLGQKVSLLPSATQTVAQPAGTQLQVNNLNGALYASQYQSYDGGDGIGNALASAACVSGCEVKVEPTYASGEAVLPTKIPAGGRVIDRRKGADVETFVDPEGVNASASIGEALNQFTVRSAQNFHALWPNTVGLSSYALSVTNNAYTGGNNLFPTNITTTFPYQKSTYGVSSETGNYYTQGQHVQSNNFINCYSVGDCLAGSRFITTSGGLRDPADEGTHPFDLQITEDWNVFQGTCSTGCTTGSTSLMVNTTSGGTQGDGRFLIDKNPAKTITVGQLTGNGGTQFPIAKFTGTNFTPSVLLATAAAATSQTSTIAPGTVTMAIKTSGAPSGYATTTAGLPASGVACVADGEAIADGFPNFETVNYQVVDTTHLQLTLNKVHGAGATVAVGGLCGYGLEQTVDTTGAVRQVFPVVASLDATDLFYAGSFTSIVANGTPQSTSGYTNVSVNVASVARQNNTVTVTLASNMPEDLNGLTLTLSGVADASYNGSFAMTTTSGTTLTFTQTGANSTSTGGTLSYLTGSYVLYPMAEVLNVYDASTKSVDGLLTLAPNNVAWASGDAVEEPHYYQQYIFADTEYVTQFMPRPQFYSEPGKQYQGNVGPGMRGWQVSNAVAASNYVGGGGTRQVPDSAFAATGVWNDSIQVDAGVSSLIEAHCNLHGCNRWDSAYSLFALDSARGKDFEVFAPQSDSVTWNLMGTNFNFSPSGFTAGTINAGTVNATTLNPTTIQTTTIQAAEMSSSCSACYPLVVTSSGTNSTNITLANTSTGGHSFNFFATGSGNGPGNFGVWDGTASVGPLAVTGGFGSTPETVATGNAGVLGWSSAPNAFGGAADTGFTRASADAVNCGNGTAGNASCTLNAGRLSAPVLRSGMASNTDIVGTLTVSAGATSSSSYSFTGSYGSAPVCLVQPQSATAAMVAGMGAVAPLVSTTALSVSVQTAPTSAVTFGYQCVGRN